MRRVILAAAFLCGIASAGSVSDEQALEYGRQIYMDGVLPSGEPLKAIVNGDVEITGDFVVCGECHRKSGLGASEGQSVAPPVVGALLYEPFQLPTSRPPAPPVLRPAYDYDSLAVSIRDGISSNGTVFGPLMPRYPLTEDEMRYLITYLESLDAGPDPGVTETHLHLATVIAGDVDPGARKAMLDVLEQFIEQKNTETRYESKRAESGPWHKDWMFKRYRKWELHTWELTGDASTWRKQLEEHYARTPVFAIVNGTAAGSWRPVHEYCEAAGIPCLFPTTSLPVADREDVYSIYMNKGIALEAEAIAHRVLRDEAAQADLLQVFDSGNAESAAAAARLNELLGDRMQSVDISVQDAVESDADTVIAWLDAARVNELPVSPAVLYLSGTLLDGQEATLAGDRKAHAQIIHSTALPSEMPRLLARSTGWLRFKRIYAPEYKEIQANAYFSLKMLGGGLHATGMYFDRDFLIENIEHMVDNATYTSVYPNISLAPEQRFVSKGVRIGGFDDSGRLTAVVDWLVPDVQ
jgi:hypothetical protein